MSRKSSRQSKKIDYKAFNAHGLIETPTPLETPKSRKLKSIVVTNTSDSRSCLATPRILNSTMAMADENSVLNSSKNGLLHAGESSSMNRSAQGKRSPQINLNMLNEGLDIHAPVGHEFESESESESECGGIDEEKGLTTDSGGLTEEEIQRYEQEVQRLTIMKKQKSKNDRRKKLKALKEKYESLKLELGAETSDEELTSENISRQRSKAPEDRRVRFKDSGLKVTSGPEDLRKVLGMEASRKEKIRNQQQPRPNLKVVVDQFSSDEEEEEEDHMLKGEKISLKSGMLGKAHDRVLRPQIWPQVAIQGATLGKSLSFKDLDLKWLIAGELEIISSGRISETEKAGRLFLLKQLVYLSNGNSIDVIKQIYSTIVGKIERGFLAWEQYDSSFQNEIQWSLTWLKNEPKTGAPSKVKKGKKLEGVFWCRDYNQGKCTKKDKHAGTMYDNPVTFHHICAKCFITDKSKNSHPETSSSCPHYNTENQD